MVSRYSSDSFMSSDDCEDTLREIEAIREYDKTHGNYSAILKELADKVREILPYLCRLPYNITPTLADSIQIEYINEIDEYLEFNIFKDKIVYFYCDKNRHMETGEISSIEEMNVFIDEMF